MKSLSNDSFVVELSEITKVFGTDGRQTDAVRNVNLRASPGELVLLLGPSGSGKTTLLTLIAGLLMPTSGSATLFGREIERYTAGELQRLRASRLGFVFQTFLLIDSLTVIENIALVLRFVGKSKKETRQRALALLQMLHLEPLAGKFPPTLSQGEKQRVAIARAIANDADLVIADEPTASLETNQGLQIIRLLHDYASQQRKCVIVASHDLRIAEFADRVFEMRDGQLSEKSLTWEVHPPRSLQTTAGCATR
jgi:putative ABC transport system ATP-binding protein